MNNNAPNEARHRATEASAGTGKTFWITEKAVELLAAEDARLDELLLMTFTERATGELKARLRAALEEACQKRSASRTPLRAALDAFDEAHVYTIHGFCQRVLREHPFETGFDFRPVHVDDPDLLEGCLRELQRTSWQKTYGAALADVLKIIGYTDTGAEAWEKLVLDVAHAFRPASDHVLRPELRAPPARVADLPTLPREKQRQGKKADGIAPEQGEGAPPTRNRWHLAVETIVALQERLQAHKQERGLISFEDMLRRVDEALAPTNPRSGLLLAALRRRFRFAIVDEFQDTDALQWRIFKRIFVEGSGPQRLFVVGDPKQAIYGFLGADVHTYCRAVRELKELHHAQEHRLATNWRSCRELLKPLNRLFGGNGRWFDGTGIPYTPVGAPNDENRVNRLTRDQSERAALTLVDLRQDQNLSKARYAYARFVAAEIRRLLMSGPQPLLEIQLKNGEPRPLRASDICILVRTRGEVAPILDTLRQMRIPYSFYKQSGLWQADEAEHLACLLRALAQPDEPGALRKALLTMLFRVRPQDLTGDAELGEDLPSVRQFRLWCDLAGQRRWGELFRSLMEDSGILFADMDDPGYERRLANFRYLFQFLEQEAYGKNRDLLGVIDVLAQKKIPLAGDLESNLQPIETERSKVRIMTVHAAKGDEYPVVFVAGGFTCAPSSRSPTWLRYRHSGPDQKLVIDLDTEDQQAKKSHEDEQNSEDRRLMYVALTRAMFKLYLPRLNTKGYQGGWDGPLVKIVASAIEATNLETMRPPFVDLVSPDLRPSARRDEVSVRGGERERCVAPEELFPVVDAKTLRQRGIRVRSYSALRDPHHPAAAEVSFVERPSRDDDDERDPLDDPGLLRGTVFGDLVHDTLEKIDFRAVAAAPHPKDLLVGPVRGLLEEVFERHQGSLPPALASGPNQEAGFLEVSRVVWNALQTPLDGLGVRLCQIPKEDRLHELEFLFPEQLPAASAAAEGFLTGFMDLVFRRADRYFLLDWKTNDLHGDYSPEALARAMQESDYERQYRLYAAGLRRWLEKRVPGFDWRKHFGGVYYLFVRGMNARDESAGVFFRKPTDKELNLGSLLAP
jgi:exodeoxyribonuclease V beta subunit